MHSRPMLWSGKLNNRLVQQVTLLLVLCQVSAYLHSQVLTPGDQLPDTIEESISKPEETDFFSPIELENTEESISDEENDFFSQIEPESTIADSAQESIEPQSWFINGFVKQQLAYAVQNQDADFPFSREYPGISQFRTSASLDVQGSLFGLGNFRIGCNGFYDLYYHHIGTDEVSLEEYRDQSREFEWGEVYANIEPIENVWFKFGRQIIAWGESDYTQILNLANPLDNRDFGLLDIEVAQLPVWATKVSIVGKRWGTDLALIHKFRSNKLATEGADFDPFINVRDSLSIVSEDDSNLGLTQAEVLWRAFFSLPSGDISLIYGKVYDDNPVFYSLDNQNNIVLTTHPRIEAMGVAANLVLGNWLLKTEFARKHGMEFVRNDFAELLTLTNGVSQLTKAKPLYQLLTGVEYSGINDVSIRVEWLGEKVGDYETILNRPKIQSSLFAAMTVDLWHDRAELGVLWSRNVRDRSDIFRLNFDYDYSDTIKIAVGYIGYNANESNAELYPYRKNDRLFTSVRYSF